MALLGTAVLAMWWNVSPDVQPEFEDWHSHEHFAERLGIPGFRRASRWRSTDGTGGIFVMYELESHATLSSAAYLAHLNAPTPWSTRMMPHHRHMVRSQCHVLETLGGAVAAHALTVRLSPALGQETRLRAALASSVTQLATRPGLTGAHLLRHERPPIAATTEQKIRGGDLEADWVFVATGYDASALAVLADAELAGAALQDAGAAVGAVARLFTLSHSATPSDVAPAVHGRTLG
jgi:hypothetical protein